MEVLVDPRAYEKSKLAPTVIAKIAKKMSQNPKIGSPRAKKRWLERVELDGERFAVMCHEEGGAIVITYVRPLKKKKRKIPRKR